MYVGLSGLKIKMRIREVCLGLIVHDSSYSGIRSVEPRLVSQIGSNEKNPARF